MTLDEKIAQLKALDGRQDAPYRPGYHFPPTPAAPVLADPGASSGPEIVPTHLSGLIGREMRRLRNEFIARKIEGN